MKTLVVYETAWGNTRAVAEAVAAGLSGHGPTEVVGVQDAPALHQLDVDLLVVGAPTHAFGLSRENTRQEAHRRGGTPPATGLRDWLDVPGGLHLRVAAFDTHVRHPNLPGAAGRKAAKQLKKLGCTVVTPPVSFWVEDYEGPLLPGELDRARDWGTQLSAHLTPRSHT